MKSSMVMCFVSLLCFSCDLGQITPGPGPAVNTAKDKLAEVNSLAQSYAKGLRLMTVSSQDVRTDGTSDVWQYAYVDGSLPRISYWFHSGSGAVTFDSNSATGVGSAVITHQWFNSDSALFIAEHNGGSQFRNQNPRCTMVAGVGEPVVPNPTTTWWITYRSKDDHSLSLVLGIDANTGVVTLKYP